jgi:hypothetical protein
MSTWRYGLHLIGWMFLTLGFCGLVFPMLASKGQADEYSVSSVLMCVVCLAVGGFIVAKTRRT